MILYNLIIRPIEILLEVVFVLMNRFFGNPGAAILSVSIIVSFLVLPLYLKADKIQEEEQKHAEKMKYWISHIRKTFSGDEKYMMQSVYYREQNYKPVYTLRGTLSILLQIPFFMAAYHYLSHVTILESSSFGPIRDLSQPDELVRIGTITIHVLPILMTFINCISGMIYTKGFQFKQKMQVYILAVLFLVLLYKSPSGLVIYWTMNNLFSLAKNIVIKHVRDKKRFMAVLLAMIGFLLLFYTIVCGKIEQALLVKDYERFLFIVGFFLIMQIPLIKYVFNVKIPEIQNNAFVPDTRIYSGLLTTVIILFGGVYIPLSVVSSSPMEFVNVYNYCNPLWIVFVSTLIYAGLFAVWGYGVIFSMIPSKMKYWYSNGMFICLLVMLVNFYAFQADMGTCEMELNFIYEPHFASKIRYGNILVLIGIIMLGNYLYRKHTGLSRNIVIILAATIIVQSIQMTIRVEQDLKGIKIVDHSEEDRPEFPLSRNGKNVVVIMLDRAIGGYIPFIMEEKPELMSQFDGFTYYPNIVSSGMVTRVGAPAIFGGYEYLAENLNGRDTELMADKHNQALKLMPQLFSDNGYHVTVSDLPYVGYQEIPDYSIYDGINVSHFYFEDRFSSAGSWENLVNKVERNLFLYSLMRTAPAMLQDNIYDGSCYLTGDGVTTDQSIRYGQSYKALASLSDYTTISEEEKGELILYANNLPHEPAYTQLPDYTYAEHVDNEGYDFQTIREKDGVIMDLEEGYPHPTEHYFVNMASLLRLGEWFDLLRREGVYDNTRIILVGDHGIQLGQFSNMTMKDGLDVQAVNTLLMVKDFNSTGFHTCEDFMTNADVPLLAMDGVIIDPVNPYTGIPMNADEKEDGVDIYLNTEFTEIPEYTIPLDGAQIYHVKDNIFIEDNWSRIY